MKRLIDDEEIARELRAELQRYATEQAQVDLKRVYAGLEASLPLTAAPQIAQQERFSLRKWSSLSGTTKLLVIAAIGSTSALGVTAFRASEHRSQPPALLRALPASQPIAAAPTGGHALGAAKAPHTDTSFRSPAATGGAAQLPGPGPAQSPKDATAKGGGARGLPESVTSASASGSRQTAARGHSDPSSASRREIAQLARIKALLEQDPAAARRLIRAAQREFPAGLLVEEREGLDAIALFALAQTERARAHAERFIARYPHSPLRAKLERLIADARE